MESGIDNGNFVCVGMPGHDFTVKKGDAYYACRYNRTNGEIEVRPLASDGNWKPIGSIPARLAPCSSSAIPVIKEWARE